jgi:hypothetical protein
MCACRVPAEDGAVSFAWLADGRPIRAMVVINDCTRECLAVEGGLSFGNPTSSGYSTKSAFNARFRQ